MAAAELPTEAEASEREMGPFEKLCRSGLRVSRPAGVPRVYGGLWKKMVLHQKSGFLPMGHLARAFKPMASMTRTLQSSPPTPKAFLFTGSKGIGKSHLFNTFADVLDKVNMSAADGRLTICCITDLQDRSSSDTGNFHEWLFKSIAEKLEDLDRHPEAAEVLRNLAAHATVSIDDEVKDEQLSDIFTLHDSTKAQSSELDEEMLGAGTLGRLGIASALLKKANIAVIAVVDEAENLFQEQKFDFPTTCRWQSQMEGVLCLFQPAIGMVVCSSSQHARQLFLSDGKPHDFPPEFTYWSLRGNWNETKLKGRRLEGAMWTQDSLKSFLLSHACKAVDPSFTLYRGKTKKQQPGAAVDAAQKAPGAPAAKEEKQPSEAALEMARKLDEMFLQRLEGEDEMSDEERLASSLERALELYGQTPRELAHAASTLFQEWELSSPWPERQASEVTEGLDKSSEDLK